MFTAPFHRVEFADFWLADQLNSLVFVLMDLEYLICFYIFELQWSNSKGLLPSGEGKTLIQSQTDFTLNFTSSGPQMKNRATELMLGFKILLPCKRKFSKKKKKAVIIVFVFHQLHYIMK